MKDNSKAHTNQPKGSYTWILPAALVLVLVLILAWFTLEKIEKQIKKDTAARLTSILNTTHESIDLWFEERAHEVQYMASLPDLKRLVREILLEENAIERDTVSPALKQLREYITLSTEGHHDYGFFILSPDFINIASLRDSNLGEKNLLAGYGDYLERIFSGETVLTMPVRSKVALPRSDGELASGEPTMFIGVPVTEKGKMIAALLVRIDPHHRFTHIIQMYRPGETGDTYAFNSFGKFISEPRFTGKLRESGLIKADQSAILNLSVRDPGGNMIDGFTPSVERDKLPLTLMARLAVKEKSGMDLDGYRDYRGVAVVGAWLWDSALGFGLTVEIDVAEVYATLNIIRRTVGLVIGLTIILFSGLTILVIIRNRKLGSVITECRMVEEELRRYHGIVDQSGDSLFILDAQTSGILDVNAGSCSALGYSRAELLKMRMFEISSYLKDMEIWNSCISQLAQTNDMTVETDHLCKDGSLLPVDVRVKLVTQEEKDYVLVSARDITERKHAEAELKKLTIAVEQSPSAVIITDKSGKIEYVNYKFFDITGYSPGEVIGKNPRILRSGFQSDDFYKQMWETITSGQEWRGDFHNIRKDGQYFWESAIIAPIKDEEGSITHFIALKEDITERKQAQERLRTLSFVIDQSPASTMILDIERRITYVNPACVEATGYTAIELIGNSVEMLRSSEHPEEFYEAIWAKAALGETWRGDVCSRRKDGTKIWELISISPVIDPLGEITHFVSVKVDDTERKEAEDSLKTSEAMLMEAQKIAHMGHWEFDISNDNLYWSDEIYRIFEIEPDKFEATYEAFIEFVHPDDRDMVESAYASSLKDKRGYDIVHRLLMKDGRVKYVHEICETDYDEDGKALRSLGMVQDITDSKILEAEAIKTQKLESIALLAGGIAHDFNNLLTSIVGNIDFAKQLSKPGEKIFDRLEKVEKASQQATILTQQLLSFSKGGDSIMRAVSVVDVAKESLDISLRGSHVSGEFIAPDDLFLVNADSGQLSQVLNNLIINAAQSMPEGGSVTITCKNLHIKSSSDPLLKQGNYVNISVQDNGSGIKEDDLKRIFDPYFTTKATGTGLGLATTYSIINNHNGIINVKSTIGKGTVFDIYLPALDTHKKTEGKDKAEIVMGDGLILVMDDDAEIGDYISLALDACGYKSKLVFTGEEAVKEYRAAFEEGTPYNAVIMDLVIKGAMGGKETIYKLKEIDPDVVGIVSSGYSNDPVMVRYEDFGFKGSLAKPYKVSELSKVIKKVLKEK